MAVLIDSGPLTATARVEDVPVAQWPELLRLRRLFCAIDLPFDCRELLRFVEDAADMLGPLGYANVTDFLERGLALDPQMVDWAVQGLKQLKPNDPIPYRRAVELGQREIGIEGGKPGPGRGQKTGSPTTRFSGRGAAYYLARLDRDRPELAAEVRAGRLTAKTAARQAGIVRAKTLLQQLQFLWTKATPIERRTFREWTEGGDPQGLGSGDA